MQHLSSFPPSLLLFLSLSLSLSLLYIGWECKEVPDNQIPHSYEYINENVCLPYGGKQNQCVYKKVRLRAIQIFYEIVKLNFPECGNYRSKSMCENSINSVNQKCIWEPNPAKLSYCHNVTKENIANTF